MTHMSADPVSIVFVVACVFPMVTKVLIPWSHVGSEFLLSLYIAVISILIGMYCAVGVNSVIVV